MITQEELAEQIERALDSGSLEAALRLQDEFEERFDQEYSDWEQARREHKDRPRIPLKDRKEYLATIPWVTVLKKPVQCTGWHNKSAGKRQCKNPAYYSFKHHKGRESARYSCFHTGNREHYCWNHLTSRGLFGDHCEEGRTDRWVEKNPPPWKRSDANSGSN